MSQAITKVSFGKSQSFTLSVGTDQTGAWKYVVCYKLYGDSKVGAAKLWFQENQLLEFFKHFAPREQAFQDQLLQLIKTGQSAVAKKLVIRHGEAVALASNLTKDECSLGYKKPQDSKAKAEAPKEDEGVSFDGLLGGSPKASSGSKPKGKGKKTQESKVDGNALLNQL